MLALRGPRQTTVVDIGAGTGAFVYEAARRRPDWFCVGLDAERRGMAALAARSLRKPARGGLGNVLFVVAGYPLCGPV